MFTVAQTLTTVIINDCRDENARMRQEARVASLIGGQVLFAGVKNDLEAAGNLVDALDAIGGQEGLILVNVAPRHGQAKKWPNGSPFGYFCYRGIFVLASLDGFTLSLAKKLGCFDSSILRPLNENVFNRTVEAKNRTNALRSQFRSLEFLPYAAMDILTGSIDRFDHDFILPEAIIPDPPKAIWYIDCFGNAKMTLLPEDVGFSVDNWVAIMGGVFTLPCYRRLNDVPDAAPAIIIGSSGIGDKRFLEIVVQGGSAAERFGLEVGQEIL